MWDMAWIADPSAWAGLGTLIVLEVVLGIDNLVFISVLASRLPGAQKRQAFFTGLGLALLIRLALLGAVAWIVGLTEPLFTIWGRNFSWRDIILLLGGVFLLGGGMGDNKAVQPMGVLLLLLSALSNSLYIVGLHVVKPRHMTGLGVTFWVLAFGSLICLGNALAMGSFSLPADLKELGIAFLLAAVTAALSNLTLVLAIQRIGSTMASVLGVMEPPTAVCVGILVFDEPSSASLWIGMCLICLSVLVVMLGPRIGSRRAKKQ